MLHQPGRRAFGDRISDRADDSTPARWIHNRKIAEILLFAAKMAFGLPKSA
jgi:hypothetical protein